jgi:hypothetical protein
MEKKNLVIIGGVVVVSGLALWLYFRKKKPTIMCKDGTKGNNTSKPCYGHGGIMTDMQQQSGEPSSETTGIKTQSPAQAAILQQAEDARRAVILNAIAHGEISDRIPMTQNEMLNEGMQLRSFAQSYSNPNISGVPEVIIKNG